MEVLRAFVLGFVSRDPARREVLDTPAREVLLEAAKGIDNAVAAMTAYRP